MIKSLEKSIAMAGMRDDAHTYIEKSAKKSVAVMIVAFCIMVASGFEIEASATVAAIAFAVSFAFLIKLPEQKAKKKGKLIEKELPFMLMSLGVELNIGISFEKALSKRASNTVLGKEIAKAISDIKFRGLSVQEALANMQSRNDSELLKRAVSQIICIYESGSLQQGDIAISMAKDILARQKAEAKEFSGKLVMMSLLFIIASAIVPALLLSYIAVGSMFLDIELQPEIVIVLFVVLLPLVDIAMLLAIREKTPVFMRA